MEKRRLIIGDYDTAADGLWTLASWKLTKGSQVQNFVSVPGRAAPLDLSTSLTDGQPYYGSAAFEAVLESSEGDRLERKDRIGLMINYMDGKSLHIILPDDPDHYLVGRVQVQQTYNDPAHCAVAVSAVCDPWLYAEAETIVELTVTESLQTVKLYNSGRLAVVPTVVVTGSVSLQFGTRTISLSDGTYYLPELCLTPGDGLVLPGVHELVYNGSGTVNLSYREAVLAV